MASKPKVCVRKTPSGKWRGYIGDVCVAEFEASATESAEDIAKRWNAAPSKPQKSEPSKVEPVKPAATKFKEHVKINCDDVERRGLRQNPSFLRLYWEMQNSFGDRKYGYEVHERV
jgi:hypothetical protein